MLVRVRYSFATLLALAASLRSRRVARGGVLAKPDFRRLWVGEGVSLLGTHFQVVALSWLVLQITDSGLALGTVLVSATVARIAFVLVGGALVDRLTPRLMMLGANIVRALCIGVLTVLVGLDTVQIWHLYVLAFVFGLMGAIFQPAYLALVPRLLPKEQVPAGNGLLFATSQLTGAIGPAIAGYVISVAGIVTAFGLNSASFLVSAAALATMSGDLESRVVGTRPRVVLSDIAAAFHWIARNRVMRPLLIAVALVNLLLAGPLSIGLPVLAHTRYQGNATALGTLLSALGTGALVGTVLGGASRGLRQRGRVVIGVVGCLGIALILVGFAASLVLVSACVAAVGLLVGFIVVVFFSWLHTSVEHELMGRVMSLVVFAAAILIPISHVVGGVIADRSPSALYITAGSLIVVVGVVSALVRPLREID